MDFSSLWSAWTWKTAWRDARSNKKRLLIYISAIIIGVAAQVAINSFRHSLEVTIDEQGKELLGADLEVEQERPFDEAEIAFFDSLGGEQSEVVEFSSMAYFPKVGETRLSQVRALQGDFPFYGTLETVPAEAAEQYREDGSALVDQTLLTQFDMSVGDSVKLGSVTFPISGAIQKVPGEAAAASMVGPRIFISQDRLEDTGLTREGSFIDYKMFFKFEEGRDMAQLEESLDPFAEEQDLRFETAEEEQEEFGEAVENLARFLNLVGFVALLLGGIGVASSIHVYIKQKISTAAVLRCMGASSYQAMNIFLVQALVLGFLGAFTGTMLGIGLQYLLPVLVEEFLPVDVILSFSWLSVTLGMITGTGIAIIFALLPLLSIRKVSPLFTLRTVDISPTQLLENRTKFSIYAVIGLTVTIYAYLLTEDLVVSLLFTLGLGLSLALLLFVARLLMQLTRRYISKGWPYVWRQGIANLYRPNNQTSTLMVTLGLGMLLVSTLYFSQDMLKAELDFATREDAPNLIFIDVQSDQREDVREILEEREVDVIQDVPVVTMRLESINGVGIEEIEEDTTRNVRGWALNREYRSTYRDSLLDSETLTEGEFIGTADPDDDVVPISVGDRIVDDLDVSLGDTLTFDVQGVPVQTYLASVRDVDFQRVQPNFFVVFPTGVLEEAPQFFVFVTHTASRDISAAAQQAVVLDHPNVSALDISLILETVNEFINKISFAIEFMALFSIATGLIVLASAVATSRFQRIRESVLLRTLGASKKQLIRILSVEYLFIGVLAALSGLILSLLSTLLLGYFYFDLTFTPNLWVIVGGIGILTLLTILIGMLNSRGIYNKTPLEVLRLETT